jgi:biopolymer transport protein ExbD
MIARILATTFPPGVLLCGLFTLTLAAGCQRADAPGDAWAEGALATPPTLKISVFASGEILADGQPCTLDELAPRLADVRSKHGGVFYFREAADQEPHANGVKVVELLVENQLPVSFSTQSDFSDYVDDQGESHPRQ